MKNKLIVSSQEKINKKRRLNGHGDNLLVRLGTRVKGSQKKIKWPQCSFSLYHEVNNYVFKQCNYGFALHYS
jgi:hypothetical protein